MSDKPDYSLEFNGNFIGRQITVGKDPRRWRVKDICYREDPKSSQNIRFFLFIGTRKRMKVDSHLKIASFIPDDITAETDGNEIAIYLDKEKTLAIRMPMSEGTPTITDE